MRGSIFWVGILTHWLVVCVSFGQPCSISPQSAAPGATPPNFILIYSDDQAWTGTSVQIDPSIPDSASDFYRTPRLEELASQGMRFTSNYAGAPVCTPSRAALLTGKSPAQLQYTDVVASSQLNGSRFLSLFVGHPLSPPLVPESVPASEITIAERLKQLTPEYRSAMIGKWHVSWNLEVTPLDQGFDVWYSGNTGAPPEEDPKDVFGVTALANQFMQDSVNLGQPFFVMISHYAVHWPHEAQPDLVTVYENLPPGQRHSDPIYAAMTEHLDTAVGMVLDQLVALGIEDNTYVIYTSDNGAIFLLGADENDPLFNAKGSLYEGGIRVPMIIRGPGIAANSVSDTPVVVEDLFTTITSLAGVTDPLPAGVEGADISPVLFNGGSLPAGMDSLERTFAANGELFFHYPHYVNGGESPRVPASSVRDGGFKLIRMYGESGQPDTLLLFDLSQSVEESGDPSSPLNLADDMPQLAAALNAKLEQWLQATNASLPYNVADDVQMHWDAGNVGDIANGWRSTIDIDQLQRETWTLDQGGGAPVNVAIPQPALPPQFTRAFRFDGNDGMTRRFFHVSDPIFPDTFDADHSSSFEFWLRAETLGQEMVLFEAGDDIGGLSITFGDADVDGVNNEVRFRILGDDGNHLTVTISINPSVLLAGAFVQLVAVYSDDPLDRNAAIYVNGSLCGWTDGVDGPDEIDWDRLDEAGLGRVGGSALGGNGGPGSLPFAGGNFVGDIALFRFDNHAIDGTEVLSRFDEIMALCPWDCANGDGQVGIDEFLAVLAQWGTAGTCDVDGGGVGITEFLTVLALWGPCP